MVLQVQASIVSNFASILVRCTGLLQRAKIFALKKASASDQSWHLENHHLSVVAERFAWC